MQIEIRIAYAICVRYDCLIDVRCDCELWTINGPTVPKRRFLSMPPAEYRGTAHGNQRQAGRFGDQADAADRDRFCIGKIL